MCKFKVGDKIIVSDPRAPYGYTKVGAIGIIQLIGEYDGNIFVQFEKNTLTNYIGFQKTLTWWISSKYCSLLEEYKPKTKEELVLDEIHKLDNKYRKRMQLKGLPCYL